jgi:hypothetical protein
MCYDAPQQDPLIGESAKANSEIAKEQLGLAREQWDYGRELTDKYAPVYEELLQENLQNSRDNNERSRDQWDQYKNTFQPIEEQFAKDASTYDSPEETQRREGLAAATVQAQADAARESSGRTLAASGVAPGSGRSIATSNELDNSVTLAKAGAINQERNNTKLLGMQLRQSAAQFGRNQPGTSIAASQAALSGNTAATNTIGAQTNQAGAALAPAASLYSGAVGANNSAANISLNSFNSQMTNAQNVANSQGQIIGAGLGIAGQFLSDENAKTEVSEINEDQALDGLRKIPVKKWAYKEGKGDEGKHIGPMAQDVHQQMGEQAAPGGTSIDPITMNGMMLAGLQALAKRVDKLAGKQTSPDEIHAGNKYAGLKSLRI